MKNILLAIAFIACASIASAQNKKDPADTLAAPGLPVLRSYVPPDVVAKAIKKYGSILYCITEVKHPNGNVNYIVGLIRNKRLSTEWLYEDLKMV